MKIEIREKSDAARGGRPSARLLLQPGETLSFVPSHRPVSVSCISGCLHVTQAGDVHDYVLQAGESARFAARGKVVASCYRGPAAAAVESAGPHAILEDEKSQRRGELCASYDRPIQLGSGSVSYYSWPRHRPSL